MGAATGLHRDDAGGPLGAERYHHLAPHAASDRHFPDQIQANEATAVLAKINAEYRDFHGFVPHE
jgi:hypothetical protein